MLSIRPAIALVATIQEPDPGMGVMTPAPAESIVVNEQSRGRAFPGSLTVGGWQVKEWVGDVRPRRLDDTTPI
jgi:hypothetical protein